ncbi:MAG: amidohydrolase family protein [Promethearchaeota archaeon]
MKFIPLSLILIILIPTPFVAAISNSQTVDRPTTVDYVFTNGNIISVDDKMTVYEAIAIEDDTIVALGNSSEVLDEYQMADSKFYDLEGATMMPGIIDGHSHAIASYYWWGVTDSFEQIMERSLSYGFTTLNEKSMFDPEYSDLMTKNLAGEVRIRLNFFMIANFASLDENNETVLIDPPWYDMMEPQLQTDEMIRVPGFKIWGDGAAGGAKGWPYLSVEWPENLQDEFQSWQYPQGNLYLNQSLMNTTVKAIQDRGFSVAIHTMGDGTLDTVLNAYEYALDGESNSKYRHQIEHNSFVRENQIQKMLDLETIHSIRGYYPTFWQDEYEAYYPSWMLEWNTNRYSLPDLGLHCYLETDFGYRYTEPYFNASDVSGSRNIDPFLHLWGMVTRKSIDYTGVIHEPHSWLSEHTISVEQALRMMTYEGAYAVKMENHTGTLEVGKYADVIIISDDPLTMNTDNLYQIENQLTMVAGNIEWQSPSYTLTQKDLFSPNTIPGFNLMSLICILLGISFWILFRVKKKIQNSDKS